MCTARFKLASLFVEWEDEAIAIAAAAEGTAGGTKAWKALVERRQLRQKTPFSQSLLSICHARVVLDAQHVAVSKALLPQDCRRERFVGEQPLTDTHVRTLEAEDMVVVCMPNACRHPTLILTFLRAASTLWPGRACALALSPLL